MNILCKLGFHNYLEWDTEEESYGKYVCLRCWRVVWYFFKIKRLQQMLKGGTDGTNRNARQST